MPLHQHHRSGFGGKIAKHAACTPKGPKGYIMIHIPSWPKAKSKNKTAFIVVSCHWLSKRQLNLFNSNFGCVLLYLRSDSDLKTQMPLLLFTSSGSLEQLKNMI